MCFYHRICVCDLRIFFYKLGYSRLILARKKCMTKVLNAKVLCWKGEQFAKLETIKFTILSQTTRKRKCAPTIFPKLFSDFP